MHVCNIGSIGTLNNVKYIHVIYSVIIYIIEYQCITFEGKCFEY
jgi:hypothetical protein